MWEKNRGGVENPYEFNPYAYHRPSVLKLKGSVVPHVLVQTITVSIAAAIITLLHETFDVNLSIPGTFTPIIGIVVGLLLSYRTNTAYDRYWEGRRLWSTMTVQIRNMTRYIWVGVREDDQKNITENKPVGVSKVEVVVAKKSVLNLLLGFVIALKHYLREEAGCGHEDLKELIANIQSTLPGFRPLAAEDKTTDSRAIKVGWFSKLFLKKLKPYQRGKGAPYPDNHNLPLEIALYLSSYIKRQSTDKRITDPVCGQLLTALNGLCDCLSQFERILRSPIPLAYSIHLSQTVWIYCLSLPFQLVSVNHWITVPLVFFSALILFGLERIGAEIENPFGYDYNDLDLDDFCGLLKRELNTISSHPPPSVKDWVYTPENYPFPNLEINAVEAAKLTPDEVRSLLERSSLEIQETVETGKTAETIEKTGTPEEEKEENSKGKNKTHGDISVDVGDVGGGGD